jgi:hypothetical protein
MTACKPTAPAGEASDRQSRRLALAEQLPLFEAPVAMAAPAAPTPAMTLELFLTIPPAWRPALMVADGMGVDSTAMLVHLHQRGIRPQAVLHADTGDEHPETVRYREERRRWLAAVGFPELTIVKRRPSEQGNRKRRDGKTNVTYSTLGQNCIENATLPGLAFGFKSCSVKWKIEPQNAWTKHWEPARRTWGHGQRIVKLIGYDAGPKDSRRAHELGSDNEYTYVYPLRELGWDRERCILEILRAGVKLPRKSACIYCPASQTWEIAELVRDQPAQADYIVLLEDTARPGLLTTEGLWRTTVKGTRGGVARPGSMADFIRALRADPTLLAHHLALKPRSPALDAGCPA